MKRKVKIGLLVVLFIMTAGIGTAGGYALYLSHKAQQAVSDSRQELNRGEKSEMRGTTVNPFEDNISVLFVGIDDSTKREKDGNALSDALILATFNEENKSVKMVSIPRDSYVNIPEVGYKDKITHAHAFGGIDATIEAVEGMFGIPVDYYVRLNFNSFVAIVNALDGIKYDVPFEMKEQNSEDQQEAIHLQPGLQELTGEEALALARTRKYDSDLARGQRQMELIQAIVQKAKTAEAVNDYGKLIDSIEDNFKTNMTFNELVSFKDYVLNENGLQYEEMQLEGKGIWINNGWYYEVEETSLVTIRKELKNHLDIELHQNKDSEFTAEESIPYY
ncbi:LCP family protein [Thalassobacillus devorans]|uniref:LCP family protein n=1 Tax=Thalassobacillus devorans TaxID=279813 RepID=UPI0004BCA529|nr:LCP family protein [Thalassobacillus devorans]